MFTLINVISTDVVKVVALNKIRLRFIFTLSVVSNFGLRAL